MYLSSCAHPSADCIFFDINGNGNGIEKLDCYTHTRPTTTTSEILYLPMCDRQATPSSRVQSTFLRWQTRLAHNVCTIKSLLLRACMRMQSKRSADAIGFHKNLTSDRTPNKSIPIISLYLSSFDYCSSKLHCQHDFRDFHNARTQQRGLFVHDSQFNTS